MPPKETGHFNLHAPRKKSHGSKLLTVVFLVLLIGVPVAGNAFYKDTPGLLKHVEKRDAFAVAALYALHHKGPPRDAEQLFRETLTDESAPERVRAGAARCLGTYQDDLVARLLGQQALDDPSPIVQEAACRAIGDNGKTSAAPFLDRVLRGGGASHRALAGAAYAVGKLQLRAYIDDVVELVNSPDYDVRAEAQAALESFTPENVTFGQDRDDWKQYFMEHG